MAHSGILDARNTPPFSSLWVFSYRSLRIRPGKHSVWCQGVTGGRDSTVPFGSPFTAVGISRPESRVRRYPPPCSQGSAPRSTTRVWSPPLRSAPSEEGAEWQTFSHEFVKMAGTRLVPPHSLAFRPEWYPRVGPPDASPLSLAEERRCAAWTPAERSAPARGLLRNRAGRPPASNPHSP